MIIFFLQTALINRRLRDIKVPDFIKRKQQDIEDYKHWKGMPIFIFLFHGLK